VSDGGGFSCGGSFYDFYDGGGFDEGKGLPAAAEPAAQQPSAQPSTVPAAAAEPSTEPSAELSAEDFDADGF